MPIKNLWVYLQKYGIFKKIMALVCFHREVPYSINQEKADAIFKVMLDPIRRKIMYCIKNKSKTVIQISEDTGLPISNVYRKIRELDEKKLLILSGAINEYGKREFQYKSKIRKVIVTFDECVMDVKIYSNLKD